MSVLAATRLCLDVQIYASLSSSLVRSLHHQSGQQGELGCLLQISPALIQLCLQCCIRWPNGLPQAVMVWAPLHRVLLSGPLGHSYKEEKGPASVLRTGGG